MTEENKENILRRIAEKESEIEILKNLLPKDGKDNTYDFLIGKCYKLSCGDFIKINSINYVDSETIFVGCVTINGEDIDNYVSLFFDDEYSLRLADVKANCYEEITKERFLEFFDEIISNGRNRLVENINN